MIVAIIGANGQLGRDLCAEFEGQAHEVWALTHSEIEITDFDSVRNALSEIRPELVVNTAAMHHLDRCESDPDRAYAVNALGARNLARWTSDSTAVLLHVSTDYVFDGTKRTPYVEEDLPRPLNVYGRTKLAGEAFVRSNVDRYFVVRSSGLYGTNPCRGKGSNFVETMLRLAADRPRLRVVDNEVLTPTSTRELARQIARLAETEAWGLYHATATGSCSWYEFAREIFRQAGVRVDLEVAGPEDFPAKVPRPAYSVLANGNLERAGIDAFRPWQAGLSEYLTARDVAVAI